MSKLICKLKKDGISLQHRNTSLFYSIEFPFVGAFVFSICFKTTVLWKLLNFLLATTSDKTGRGRLEKSPSFPCHPDQNKKKK